MVCNCLVLRSEGKMGKFIETKCTSVLNAVVQLLLWVTVFSVLVWLRSFIKDLYIDIGWYTYNDVEYGFTIIYILVTVGFTVLLLVGLIKDRQGYIKTYLIFIFTMIIITLVVFLYKLFSYTPRLSWTFSVLCYLAGAFYWLLFILSFFITRTYYMTITSTRPQTRNNNV